MVQKTTKKPTIICTRYLEVSDSEIVKSSSGKRPKRCLSYQCALFDVRPKTISKTLTKLNRSEMDPVVA